MKAIRNELLHFGAKSLELISTHPADTDLYFFQLLIGPFQLAIGLSQLGIDLVYLGLQCIKPIRYWREAAQIDQATER